MFIYNSGQYSKNIPSLYSLIRSYLYSIKATQCYNFVGVYCFLHDYMIISVLNCRPLVYKCMHKFVHIKRIIARTVR